MQEGTQLAAALEAPVAGARIAGARRRHFHVGVAALMLLLVLLGFAPTLYLRDAVGPPAQPMPAALYVHGIAMTAWFVLFLVQASLVSGGRVDLHRRLGIAGVALAAVVIATMGYVATGLVTRIAELVATGRMPYAAVTNTIHLHRVLLLNVVILALMPAFLVAALVLRNRPAWHRRLMFWAFAAALPPALSPNRLIGQTVGELLPSWLMPGPLLLAGLFAAAVVHDLGSRRSVHPATLIGGLLTVSGLVLVQVVPTFPAWRTFVAVLIAGGAP